MLDFWFSTCGWCELSLKDLQIFYDKHKNSKDIVVLTINTDPGDIKEFKIDAVKRFISKNKISIPVLLDFGNEVTAEYKLGAYPQLFVIGKDGMVHYRESGYGGSSTSTDLEKIIAKINGGK